MLCFICSFALPCCTIILSTKDSIQERHLRWLLCSCVASMGHGKGDATWPLPPPPQGDRPARASLDSPIGVAQRLWCAMADPYLCLCRSLCNGCPHESAELASCPLQAFPHHQGGQMCHRLATASISTNFCLQPTLACASIAACRHRALHCLSLCSKQCTPSTKACGLVATGR